MLSPWWCSLDMRNTLDGNGQELSRLRSSRPVSCPPPILKGTEDGEQDQLETQREVQLLKRGRGRPLKRPVEASKVMELAKSNVEDMNVKEEQSPTLAVAESDFIEMKRKGVPEKPTDSVMIPSGLPPDTFGRPRSSSFDPRTRALEESKQVSPYTKIPSSADLRSFLQPSTPPEHSDEQLSKARPSLPHRLATDSVPVLSKEAIQSSMQENVPVPASEAPAAPVEQGSVHSLYGEESPPTPTTEHPDSPSDFSTPLETSQTSWTPPTSVSDIQDESCPELYQISPTRASREKGACWPFPIGEKTQTRPESVSAIAIGDHDNVDQQEKYSDGSVFVQPQCDDFKTVDASAQALQNSQSTPNQSVEAPRTSEEPEKANKVDIRFDEDVPKRLGSRQVFAGVCDELKKNLTKTDLESNGQVYLRRVNDHDGYFKVGRCKVYDNRRAKYHDKCKLLEKCELNDNVNMSPIRGHHRCERLILHELLAYRRKAKCPSCRSSGKEGGDMEHIEFVEVTWDRLKQVYKKWLGWLQRDPYDETGNLMKDWAQRLDETKREFDTMNSETAEWEFEEAAKFWDKFLEPLPPKQDIDSSKTPAPLWKRFFESGENEPQSNIILYGEQKRHVIKEKYEAVDGTFTKTVTSSSDLRVTVGSTSELEHLITGSMSRALNL